MVDKSIKVALICVVGALTITRSQAAPATKAEALTARETRTLVKRIGSYKRVTWHWQRVMGVQRAPFENSASRSKDAAYTRWVLSLWRRRAERTVTQAKRPPHKAGWRCIHRYEGSWRANTGNGFYGGLQMDLSFQRRYGAYLLRRKGTADKWSPLEQMWVAERAHRSGRGFYPWPHTARYCGLI
jgi:transglycosylase-like protein